MTMRMHARAAMDAALRWARRARAVGVWLSASTLVLTALGLGRTQAQAAEQPAAVSFDADGTVHAQAMSVPFSSFASQQARKAFVAGLERMRDQLASGQLGDVAKLRSDTAAAFAPLLARSTALYPVTITPTPIAGVYTEVIEPKGGIPVANRNRVLINLHGGGFFVGARVGGRVEAAPVAGLGRFKVVAVDYREGPEFKFPAASQDVVAVYRELLKQHPAKNIGIYGCSAGGLLTTEVLAMLQRLSLPRPGAAGVFCASASGWAGGDSTYFVSSYGLTPAQTLTPHFAVSDVAYFSEASLEDPLVAPIRSAAMLANFPPTLLITGTRDVTMSSTVYTHSQLVKLGVDAELHVWEGVGHGFFYDPDLPESREAYAVIVSFFDRHLGR